MRKLKDIPGQKRMLQFLSDFDNAPDHDGVRPGRSCDPDPVPIRSSPAAQVKNQNKSKKKMKKKCPSRVQPQRSSKTSLFPKTSSPLSSDDDDVNSPANHSTHPPTHDDSIILQDIGSDSDDELPDDDSDDDSQSQPNVPCNIPSSFSQLMMDTSRENVDSHPDSNDSPISELRSSNDILVREVTSLRAENSLLFDELRDCEKESLKVQKTLQSEVKRLKSENNDIRRELSKHTGMRRFTQPPSSVSTPSEELVNARNEINILNAKLMSLKQLVSEYTDKLTSEINTDDISVDSNASPRTQVPHSPKTYASVTKSSMPQSNPASNTPSTTPPAPTPTPLQTDNSHRRRRQEAQCFGSSLNRGVGSRLVQRGIDATAYTFPGSCLPYIREKVKRNVGPNTADQIVLQGGGNDCEKYPVELVENEYFELICETRRCAPNSNIVICKVPRRKYNKRLNDKIDRLNSFLEIVANKSDGVECVDCRPSFPNMYSNDKIHFNQTGKDYYGDILASALLNFQAKAIMNVN